MSPSGFAYPPPLAGRSRLWRPGAVGLGRDADQSSAGYKIAEEAFSLVLRSLEAHLEAVPA